jgi:hypothetical protein
MKIVFMSIHLKRSGRETRPIVPIMLHLGAGCGE